MSDKEKVVVPFKIEKEAKNRILGHCRSEGMTLSGLIRKLLREYEEKEGLIK